jgi:hypothetical protein
LAGRIHQPLMKNIAEMIGYEDMGLLDDQAGFPMSGALPYCGIHSNPDKSGTMFGTSDTIEELRKNRIERNIEVLRAVKERGFSGDIAS